MDSAAIADAFLRSNKSQICVVLRYNLSFYTTVNELDLSPYFSIIVMNVNSAQQLADDAAERRVDARELFDATHVIDELAIDFTSVAGLRKLYNLGPLELPHLEGFVRELLEATKIASSRVHIVVMFEDHHRPVAKIRERLGLPGPKFDDVLRFCNKEIMIEHVKSTPVRHLKVPKTTIISFDELASNGRPAWESVVASLEAVVGGYPMLLKPSDACFTLNVHTCKERHELIGLLQRLYEEREHTPKFLVQEFIDGAEYELYALVKEGKMFVQTIHRMARRVLETQTNLRLPTAERTLDADGDRQEYEEVKEIGEDLVGKALHPVPDGNFSVQVMKRGRDWYFVECAARVPGDLGPNIIELASGLNAEVAQIMLSLPATRDAYDCNARWRKTVASFQYPRRTGTLKAHVPVPETVKSEVLVKWFCKIGDNIDKEAWASDDTICYLMLSNADHQQLVSDYDQVLHFEPFTLA